MKPQCYMLHYIICCHSLAVRCEGLSKKRHVCISDCTTYIFIKYLLYYIFIKYLLYYIFIKYLLYYIFIKYLTLHVYKVLIVLHIYKVVETREGEKAS